jgi:putative ABC transport system permease protein
MLGLTWMRGLIAHRPGRLVAASLGVAVAVALLASIATFLSTSKATMTSRSVATVAIDWQVETRPGTETATITDALRATPSVVATSPVGFADTTGLTATTAGPAGTNTTQSTGPGVVLGLPADYRNMFPDAIRDLSGAPSGVLIAQQTAANLHVGPGDTVTIGRAGLDSVNVRVDGVVDLPQADSLFQTVGAPAASQPQAPPDNIILIPDTQWHTRFDPLAATGADQVRTQVHVRLDHALPTDPVAAYDTVVRQAHNLEARIHGGGVVGDNLGATLASARADALYAQVLFLFLGLPGAILAGLLTAAVASAGATRRRQDQALLRTRGATAAQLTRIAVIEALVVGGIGSALGLAGALAVGRLAFGTVGFGGSLGTAAWWVGAAVVAGIAIAVASIALPARRDVRAVTIAAARQSVGRARNPRWMRLGLDFWLLATALVVFWLTSQNGYKLVLAVEGVPTISVSYWAFAGPALLWVGAALLTWRLTTLFLKRGRAPLGTMLRPVAGGLADTVAAAMGRQRRLLATGAVLVALTASFATSTAVFNATYHRQAAIDAALTNGADVRVTQSLGVIVGPDQAATLTRLAAQPDALLVSDETVKDYQLALGDPIKLRLQDSRTKQLVDVAFHYAGVAKEFPTAPHDSFLIANADYIAQATGSNAVGSFLITTSGSSPTEVANRVRDQIGTTASVTDIGSTRQVIGSSLTAVDLNGLTRVELGFALILAAASTGLVLWLGLAERRRTFAIAAALGATPRQLGGFVWAEAALITVVGLLAGALSGWALSVMLVKVLTGVFDPPPDVLTVPWGYLAVLVAVALSSVAVAAAAAVRATRRAPIAMLRAT